MENEGNNYFSSKPIRILHVTGGMDIGGAESMVMNIYRKIDRSKIQFDFLYFVNKKCYFDDEITSLGGKIYYCSPPQKINILKFLKSFRDIVAINGPFQAIHVHTLFSSGLILFASRLTGIKKRICHAHSTSDKNDHSFSRRLYRSLMKLLIKVNANILLACGEHAGKYLYGKTILPRKKFILFPNAIDLSPYRQLNEHSAQEIQNTLGITSKDIVIGHVGRFAEPKNHSFLIDIVKQLSDFMQNFKVVLVGDGPLREKIETKIKENNLEKYFLLLGVRTDIAQIMHIFDIFLFPSLYEGLPVSLIEAQACGVKCIVSTSIPTEADLGIGLFKFLSLEESALEWATELINEVKKEKIDRNIAIDIVASKGYDVDKSVKEISSIYSQ
jgi:glycosyltransferase EpsF